GVKFELKSGDGYPGDRISYTSPSGTAFVSNQRIVFLPATTTHETSMDNGDPQTVNSFTIPHGNLQDQKFVQPLFGANRFEALATPVAGGSIAGRATLVLSFKEGGGFDFANIARKMSERIRETGDVPPYEEELPGYDGPPAEPAMQAAGGAPGYPDEAPPGYEHHEPSRRPAMALALDFDQTLTTTDTLSAIAAIAKRKHADSREFSWFTKQYLADYAAHESRWAQLTANRAVSRDLLNRYLESVRPVEAASLDRMSQHGLLAGLTRADLYTGGRLVQLRPNAADVVGQFLHTRGCHVCVVSVNWSADFIRGALDASGVDSKLIRVYCNDLDFDTSTGVSSGKVRPRLVVAGDKVAAIAKFKNEIRQQCGGDPLLVYAGDSLTDLPALLLADIGLLVGQSSRVTRWCHQLGVEFGKPRTSEGNRILYRLHDWASAPRLIDQAVGRAHL
ncbi:hypothetical protein H4S02_008578, partial [Coemansia sp. RSA 2611]